MQNEENEKTGQVFVTILFTESQSSFLKINAPHLDHFDPNNSNLCLVTGSDLVNIFKNNEQIDSEIATTSCNSNKMTIEKEPNTSKIVDMTDSKNSAGRDIYKKISKGLAFFSMNEICSSSSCIKETSNDSLLEQVDLDKKNSKPILFEAVKVQNVPFVTVRSMAHSNKMKLESNELCISLLDYESDSDENFCRICHGSDSTGDLFTPCRCRGTVALVHMNCLERWLKESNHTYCELCQHHFKIIRQPKYNIPWSIFVFLRHPGEHLRTILLDVLAFSVYTPTAMASTYMLLLICEQMVKSNIIAENGAISSHLVAFVAVFGMAVIDFTYSTWLIMCLQKHYEAWREWYNTNTKLKIILPPVKQRPKRFKRNN